MSKEDLTHTAFSATVRSFMVRCVRILALLTFLAAVTAGQAGLDRPVPTDPDVKIGRLENGLTYYIRKNAKPENKVELRLAVNAGSILEKEYQRGLAHFLEHMAFNGSRNFKKNELVSYLQSIGVRFGADLNAYTSFDETVYMLSIPTEKPELLDKGFLVLSDWASGMTFDPEEIDKERGVVLEELRLGKGASQRMRDRYFPKLFKGSMYAERLPIGTEQILRNFKHEQLKEFYADWYRPDLMAVIAVGDLDVAAIESKIKEQFGGMPARKDGKDRKSFPVPDHAETLVAVETDKEAPFTQVQVMFKKPPSRTETLAEFRSGIVKDFYNGMINARLDELGRAPEPPFIAGGSGFSSFVRAKDAYSLFGITDPSNVDRTLKALLLETKRVQLHGFTEGELEREKRRYITRLENRYKEREKTESIRFANEYVYHFLRRNPIPGVEFEFEFAKTVLPTIKLEEVNGLAKNTTSSGNRVVVVTGPEKDGITYPGQEEIAALLTETEKAEVAAYKDTVRNEPLVENLASKATIEGTRRDEKFGITYWQLSNGVKVVLKPTDLKEDQILMRAFSPGGLSLVSDEQAFAGSYVSQIVNDSGLKDLSRVDLDKLLSGNTARVSVSLSDAYEYVNGSSTPKDLETLFQLTYLQFSQVNFDEKVFRSYMNREMKFVENLLGSPEIYFNDQVSRIMSSDHPRHQGIPSVEKLEKLEFSPIKSIYADRFGNASDFTFIFVGNFDEASIRPLALKYLGSLPGSDRDEEWKDLGMRPPDGPVEKTIRKGVEQKSQVRIFFTRPAKFDVQESRDLSAVAELLTIRLIEILREEKSGVYGVGASGNISKIPYERSNFTISFPCGPENVDSLVEAALAEVKRIQAGDISEEDLNKVKEARLVRAKADVQRNEYWALEITRSLLQDLEMSNLDDIVTRTNAIKIKDLQDAANKYIDLGKGLKFVLMPEAGPAKD